MIKSGAPATTIVSLVFLLLTSSLADAAKVLVPAYIGSWGANACTTTKLGGAWKTIAAGGSNTIAIVNPNSGPDYSGNDATVKCLPHLSKAKVTSIGYVATGFGSRSIDDVKADITKYEEDYQAAGMKGLFFDEGTNWWETTEEQLAFYAEIAEFARDSGFGYLVINPGTRFPPQFLEYFDMVVGYEHAGSKWKSGQYQGICPTPSFSSKGDAGYCIGTQNCDVEGGNCVQSKKGQVAAIIICQGSSSMPTMLSQAQKAGYGAIFVTDKGCKNSNPFDRLPTYFSNARVAVARG